MGNDEQTQLEVHLLTSRSEDGVTTSKVSKQWIYIKVAMQ